MDYLKINYQKLLHLKIPRYVFLDILFVLLIIFLVIYSCTHYITKKITCYGIYDGLVLKVMANETLSDALSANKTLYFNKEKLNYEIDEYGEYEIINEIIYQQIDLNIDKELYDNEAGTITLYYDKEKIITFILKLFKWGGNMIKLNNEEMLKLNGGAMSASMATLITGIVSGVIVFFAGILNGTVNSKACK